MIDLTDAIFALNPSVTHIVGGVAYDAENNVVEYNEAAAQTYVTQQLAAKQAVHDSATAKLKAIGLTDDEISALKGTL